MVTRLETDEQRSCFRSTEDGIQYVQQYDRRGNPENPASKALERDSRRAMNDVLAAVGVCDGSGGSQNRMVSVIDQHKAASAVNKSTVQCIIRENSAGYRIALLEEITTFLVSDILAGFRQRFQVSPSHLY